MNNITSIITEHRKAIDMVVTLEPQIRQLAQTMVECLKNGRKILWMGNGGSAADAQHLAAELVGRFTRERPAMASIALTTDTSILTAVGNDYGYDTIFSRQVEGLCKPDDLVIGISTSGNSVNVLNGIEAAKRIGAHTAGMCGGNGGKLVEICDRCITVSAPSTARVQEAHILIGHILCELVEAAIAGEVDNV